MSRSSRSFGKKIRSLIAVAVGGTGAFAAISIYQGNEKFYRELLMPAIHYCLGPENAHTLAINIIKFGLIPQSRFKENSLLETNLWGLTFKNPVGIAAGFDKNGDATPGLFKTGVGFLEIGSVTPVPQVGNPKPRIFRLEKDQGIINRCGFNSLGHDYVKIRLRDLIRPHGIVGVNLGKNKLSDSIMEDYVSGIKQFNKLADYLVINVSSPNTPGLRSLQKAGTLEDLLDKVLEARRNIGLTRIKIQNGVCVDSDSPPILLKIAPDLSFEEKKDIAKAVLRKGKRIDGLIVCNTTITRPPSLESPEKDEVGGLSGKPLSSLSLDTIKDMYTLTKGQIPIVGVGGISSGKDAYERIRAGASLVQVYSALVYSGPPLIDKIKKELQELLVLDGYTNVSEAVGAAHRKS